MSREDPQFKLRLPADLKAKLDQRAKLNGRSINAELVQIVQAALEQPSPVSGYRDDAERLAAQQAEQFKKVVFDTLKDIYGEIKSD
ncbi:Arc family DNA-binding protein [Klebsiella pneumoniae]|uniref:Arc family DNA-binding protein n=1 Tax=Klebsiella pneumoniae TaxID=573 RepID=UPI0015D77A46|nr:Arc family DNA-binding protein [Klebsiella pneumoniae]